MRTLPSKTRLQLRQKWSLSDKIWWSESNIKDFIHDCDGPVSVSFSGGKDSSVLLDMVCNVWKSRPCHDKPLTVIYANTSNEFASMPGFVESFCRHMEKRHGVVIDLRIVRSKAMSYKDVIHTIGYPIASKKVSSMVEKIRRWMRKSGTPWSDIQACLSGSPSEQLSNLDSIGSSKSTTLYLTGFTSTGTWAPSYILPKKWYPLITAPFWVSEKCCEVLKKQPLAEAQKDSHLSPIIATMASDSQQREKAYLETGCNSFKAGKVKSTPMGFWLEQDVLAYLYLHNLPTAPMYGELKVELTDTEDSTTKYCYRFTGEQRTGCKLCLFGTQFPGERDRLVRLAKLEPATVRWALKPVAEGGLGYREVVEYLNANCKCAIELPY